MAYAWRHGTGGCAATMWKRHKVTKDHRCSVHERPYVMPPKTEALEVSCGEWARDLEMARAGNLGAGSQVDVEKTPAQMRHCHQSVPYASELSETVDMNQDQNAQRILRSWRESKNLLIMASDQDKVLRIIQANLGREIIASNELLQDATTRGAALLLVQEPYASDGQVCGLGKYANNIITGNEKGEIPAQQA
ncbi:unnamed protein product [Trichogramma brassicae]|uniref:Uncharacterized protein n=1 Tax=Trichogramma brassicae TaxID=86971 RepID=A0A6H5I3E2_9HYME|nr:unnamed protein product [Trichogramma brassicae]